MTETFRCLNCQSDEAFMILTKDPLVWRCMNCSEIMAMMNGEPAILPTSGSLKDWPEMQLSMDNTVKEFLKEVGWND